MAKDWERGEAEKMYIKEGKYAKDIAQILKVTEKTVGNWVEKYSWRERRATHISSVKSGSENINELINIYAEKAIELERKREAGEDMDMDLAELLKMKVSYVDAISKLNKAKEGFEKENKIPYNVYINVAEKIMNAAIEHFPEKKRGDLLDFFEDHINSIALNYK